MNISIRLFKVLFICILFTNCIQAGDVNDLNIGEKSAVTIELTKLVPFLKS